MDIKGEVNVYHTVDEYFEVECELDMDRLAEELCQDHNLVDDVALHNYVDERVNDYELKVQVDDLDAAVNELRDQIGESKELPSDLTPEELVDVVNSLVDERFKALFARLAELVKERS